MKKIIVLIVTYNRKLMLLQSIKAVLEQEYNIFELLVVDNNSTDGTLELLCEEEYVDRNSVKEETLIHKNLKQLNGNNILFSYVKKTVNDGGAGGFYWGLNYIAKGTYDWVWIMDDDAFLEPSTISKIMNYSDDDCVAALTATVVDKEGTIDLGHRKRILNRIDKPFCKVPLEEYNKDTFDLDLFSYVGTCIRHTALLKAGLPNKDYFIFYDDTEHSIRIGRCGIIRNVNKSIVHHQVLVTSYIPMSNNWKTYYQYRNSLRTYKAHFTISFYCLLVKVIMKMVVAILMMRIDYAKVLYKAIRDL